MPSWARIRSWGSGQGVPESLAQERMVSSRPCDEGVRLVFGPGSRSRRLQRVGGSQERTRDQLLGCGRVQLPEREPRRHPHAVEQSLQQQCPVEGVAGPSGERALRTAKDAGVDIEADAVAHEGERRVGVAAEFRGCCADEPFVGGQGGRVLVELPDQRVPVDRVERRWRLVVDGQLRVGPEGVIRRERHRRPSRRVFDCGDRARNHRAAQQLDDDGHRKGDDHGTPS